jgi:hypothetical protein
MSPAEVAWRVEDRLRQEAWAWVGPGPSALVGRLAPARGRAVPVLDTRPAPTLPSGVDLAAAPPAARRRLLEEASALLEGRIDHLGVTRTDLRHPRWSLDPTSGRTYPRTGHAFRIDLRAHDDPRSPRHVWELSRHHHLTLLAAAWRVSGDDRFAACAAAQLRSWWAASPVLTGVNWSSGIELGVRLVSWAWLRRLLDGWAGAQALFDENPVALEQLWWHQRHLEAFPSRGSSGNNHAIAEAAGLLVASCAFPWFPQSAAWRAVSAARLETTLATNTFASGLDREQAFEYHGFVAELCLAATAEAAHAGRPLSPATHDRLCRMLDVTASVLDRSGRPPRDGDGDGGRGLVLDSTGSDRWRSLLAAGGALFGPLAWWPPVEPDVRSVALGGLAGGAIPAGGRPRLRQSHFADAGLTILRSPAGSEGELWCRCDGGPHGFLSIAAHAHADALSIELRHDGVDVLADPGTFCYHGAPEWRRYFRSTVAHNTIELDRVDQSTSGGPFLWCDHAATDLFDVDVSAENRQSWAAEHHGYARLPVPATHRRSVTLDHVARSLHVVDLLRSDGPHDVRMAFHLGPAVDATVEGSQATLEWAGPTGDGRKAVLLLPDALDWRAERGSTGPILGWYSNGFGERQPATTLVGEGRLADAELVTELTIL